MDAFVFPSTWEGLGIVAIEAQASGLECYLSRELPKEVEVTDAVTWFDVSENENAIANMIDLTKVPEETRYIRNREVAENGYDMQETANRLMKIYLSLIGECIFGRRLLLRVKPYIHRRRNISEFLIKLLIRQSNGLNSIQRKSNFRRHTLAYYFQD